jgi:hypothetical protein
VPVKSLKVHGFEVALAVVESALKVLVEAVSVYFPPHFLNYGSILFPFRFASDFHRFSSKRNKKKLFFVSKRNDFRPHFARFASEPKRAAHPALHSSITFYLQIRILQTKSGPDPGPNIFFNYYFLYISGVHAAGELRIFCPGCCFRNRGRLLLWSTTPVQEQHTPGVQVK